MAYNRTPNPLGHPRVVPGDLDDWNPMAESYRDSTFGAYGRTDPWTKTYTRGNGELEHKLYVSNVPMNLTQIGIQRIFDQFGKTLRVISHPEHQRAFISYGTYQEADYALHKINATHVMGMKADFAREKESARVKNQQRRAEDRIAEEFIRQMDREDRERYALQERTDFYGGPVIPNRGRGRQLADVNRNEQQYRAAPFDIRDGPNVDLLNPSIYEAFDTYDRFDATNSMWNRARVNIETDGTRRVSMGRGHNWYELPPPHPRLAQQIGAVCGKRVSTGLYVCGENELADDVGKCQNCFKPSTMRCQRCNGFYCDRVCQMADWQRHKIECQAMPGLKSGANDGSYSLSGSSCEEAVSHQPANNQRPLLRRPRKPLEGRRIPNSFMASTPLPGTNVDAVSSNPPAQKKSDESVQADQQHKECKENIILNELCKSGDAKSVSDHGKVAPVADTVKNTGDMTSQVTGEKNNTGNESLIGKTVAQNTSFQCQPTSDKQNKKEDLQNMNLEPPKNHSNGAIKRQGYHNSNQYPNNNVNGKGFSRQNEKQDDHRPMGANHSKPYNKSSDQHRNFVPNRQNVQTQKPASGDVGKNDRQQKPETKSPDFSFRKKTADTPFLSTYKFTDVTVVVPEGNGVYWIQKVEDLEALANMMLKLNEQAKNLPKVKPSIGNVYAIALENIWHRARLSSLNPMKVVYVDFGNEAVPDNDDFRKLTDPNCPPYFAKKIRVVEGSSSKFKELTEDAIISVKSIGGDSDEEILVQVEGENILADPFAPSTSKKVEVVQNLTKLDAKTETQPELKAKTPFRSVLDLLVPKDKGFFQVIVGLSNNAAAGTIYLPKMETVFQQIMQTLPDECQNMPHDPKFSPKQGDLICGNRGQGDWIRGFVTSVGPPLRMTVVDEAREAIVGAIRPIPQHFVELPTIGAICEVFDKNFKLQERLAPYSFLVVGANTKEGDGSGLEVLLSSNGGEDGDFNTKGLLKPWTPAPVQKGVTSALLTSGSQVCLTSYRSHYHLFARSLVDKDNENYHRIMQDVGICAVNASPLSEPPVKGQMVIAKFTGDGNYYRATVGETVKDKINVSYVDFGNTELVSLNNLSAISDDLKQRPSCTAKITLMDVPRDVPMTKEVNDFLAQLVGREQPLKCTIIGERAIDGVRLMMPDGKYVNDKLKDLLTPSWKKDHEEDKTVYMLSDLEVASLGEEGQVVTAIVLHIECPGVQYVLAPQDNDLIRHITDVMAKQIDEYCNATKEHYIPREGELCLAPFESVWYRAACLEPNTKKKTSTSTVLFIDFGNIEYVAHTDIRLITKDFVTTKRLGSICMVEGLGPITVKSKLPDDVAKRVSELVTSNDMVQVKIVKSSDVCEVEMPEIRRKLIKEGLIEP